MAQKSINCVLCKDSSLKFRTSCYQARPAVALPEVRFILQNSLTSSCFCRPCSLQCPHLSIQDLTQTVFFCFCVCVYLTQEHAKIFVLMGFAMFSLQSGLSVITDQWLSVLPTRYSVVRFVLLPDCEKLKIFGTLSSAKYLQT